MLDRGPDGQRSKVSRQRYGVGEIACILMGQIVMDSTGMFTAELPLDVSSRRFRKERNRG